MPYKCEANMATDEIFESWSFRLVSNPVFAVVSQVSTSDCCGCSWATCASRRDLVDVPSLRAVDQHDPELLDPRSQFGYRRYDDERDNAMNIGEWLPVTRPSAPACRTTITIPRAFCG
jgi:hypothetical protein